MSADAPSYVARLADQELLEHVTAGDFCYVLTPRQMGKSSLVVRTVARLTKKDIHSVIIDLQGKIERGMTVEAFYAGLLDAFIRELKLPIELTRWWQERTVLSAVQRFSNFVADKVLPQVQKRLVIFIDEIDSTLNLDFSDDFFAALRAFYNGRSRHPAFTRLAFVLLGVASPSDLMKDRARSPFNIGHRIELTDFTLEEARKLTQGFPLDVGTAERLLEGVLDWTGGHPYLTQKVCASLATAKSWHADAESVDKLIDTLFLSDTTWSDTHLAHIRDYIVEDKDNPDAMLELYRHIFSGEQILDDERSPIHASLKLSGIVKTFPGGVLRPRNRIYERVFDLAWVDTIQRSRVSRQLPAGLDLETWKAKVSKRLRDWRSRLERTGVGSVYTFLAGVALEPVIQAARADKSAGLIALGSVVADVGDSWLASHIQGWQDEVDAAQQIARHMVTEPALRAELDAVLETLEVFPRARQGLPAADRQWFVETLLADLLDAGHLSRVERAAAGDTLARLGDPRFRDDAWYLPNEPLLGFVEIPTGPFLLGSEKGDPLAYDEEVPQHKVTLPRYYIAKYPVTVAQFREFVNKKKYKPRDEDSLRGLPNHPVVDVTWHDAVAYCKWLTDEMRNSARTPEPLAVLLGGGDWRMTLPSEAEWEKAGRGGTQLSDGATNPNPGRIYPWGNEFDPNKANTDQTKIGNTSAVGCFPHGASPDGVLDMAGNVWEWTRSLWGKDFRKAEFGYPYDPKDGRESLEASDEVRRVLRGGSFFDNLRLARCASRYRVGPYFRFRYVGFRVVASPF